jgi:hypothetical protein
MDIMDIPAMLFVGVVSLLMLCLTVVVASGIIIVFWDMFKMIWGF